MKSYMSLALLRNNISNRYKNRSHEKVGSIFLRKNAKMKIIKFRLREEI